MVCRNITLRGNNAALRRVATRDSQLPGSARLNGRPPCPPISVPLYSSLSSSKRTYGLSRVYFNTWTSLQHTHGAVESYLECRGTAREVTRTSHCPAVQLKMARPHPL